MPTGSSPMRRRSTTGSAPRRCGVRLICISRTSFPTADPDEYYWVDLIGLEVVERAMVERLGEVVGLIDTGPHAVLRVAPVPGTAAADEILIPFVAAYVDAVSLQERRISVDWGADY